MAIEAVVIGGRGYTGSELLPLLYRHPECSISAVGSTTAAGQPLGSHIEALRDSGLVFSDIRPEKLAGFPAQLYVLALPNGEAASWVEMIDRHQAEAVVIDLSADFRFDPAWAYGLPERFGASLKGARRIANPGCYATGAQLALAPVCAELAATPVVFGVSGFSGAGKTPSRKNNPEVLRDNLLPYALADHLHEREMSRHLARDVRFLPHVAPFFRGISLTVAVELKEPQSAAQLAERFADFYRDAPLVSVCTGIPEVTQVRDTAAAIVGGFTVSRAHPARASLVCVLDNLLKGAASQAVQNLNLAFGFEELTGLEGCRSERGRVEDE
jgi:N-acetyl-gamma-glutamyl-phosphate reductase